MSFQIAELTQRYAELEEKLKLCRSQCQSEVTSFLDDDLGVNIERISRGLKRIDSRVYSHHQVLLLLDLKHS